MSPRWIIPVACVLFTAQAIVIAQLENQALVALLSELVQLLLGVLCVLASVKAFRFSHGIARYAWRLLAVSFCLWIVGQILGVYIDVSGNRSLDRLDDVIFFLSVIPFGMLLVLDPTSEPDHFDRLHTVDFLQVSIFWLAVYLYFSPQAPASGASVIVGPFIWSRNIAYDGLLFACFVLRGMLSASKAIRALFLRMALFLLLSGLADSYAIRPGEDLPPGGWFDLVWSLLLVIPLLIAATWNNTCGEEDEKAGSAQSVVTNQFFPLLYPFLSCLILAQIDKAYELLAAPMLVLVFVGVAIRVLIIQRRHARIEAQLRIDVAERKHAEQALRDSEQKCRELIEHATYGIFRADADGTLSDVNPALVQMLAYSSREELMACNLNTDIYLDPAARSSAIEKCEVSGRVDAVEVDWKRKDGKIIVVRMSGRTIRDENGKTKSFEVIVDDITEHRRLEQQLRQAQKMEAVGRLAGGIAHDFNNALGVITGYSELLQMNLPSEDPRYKQAEEIGKAGKRAATLTRQLLAFSRKQIIQPTVLDLNLVVADIHKMLSRLIGEDIALSIVPDLALRGVNADRGKLEQILMNLAVNARDAMPKGGTLIIETASVVLDELYVSQHLFARPGSYAVLAVSDTGCGMDKETQSHLFEPFFTTKPLGKGTGLGLSTVYGIVKQSEGHISVYSEVDKGTTFRIYLPQVEHAAGSQNAVQSVPPHAGGSETILLVEDEPALRELSRGCLQSSGYVVLEAQDGNTAIQIANEHDGPIYLLLTDLVMPGLNGYDLAEHLSRLRPNMRVLYMSGYTNDLITQQGVMKPGTTLLEKPFSVASLLMKVRTTLDSSPADSVCPS